MQKTNAIYFDRIDLAMCQQQTNLTKCHDLKLKQKNAKNQRDSLMYLSCLKTYCLPETNQSLSRNGIPK